MSASPLARFRPWLYAAAAYNLAWGAVHVLEPSLVPGLLGLEAVDPLVWQLAGLFVGVYAPAYFWAARHPGRHAHIVAVGVLGKLAGVLGFAWAAASGALPVHFGLVILTNDVVWLPALCLYLHVATRECGGWRALAAGA